MLGLCDGSVFRLIWMQRFRGLRVSEAVLSALVTLLLLALAIACFVTRMEALYRVWKDEGERSGRLAYEQLQSLPIEWVDQTEPLLLEVSRSKASHPLSIARQCRCIKIRHMRPSLNWIRVGWSDDPPDLSVSRCRAPKCLKTWSKLTRRQPLLMVSAAR
mgnify:CR=1 FL=1